MPPKTRAKSTKKTTTKRSGDNSLTTAAANGKKNALVTEPTRKSKRIQNTLESQFGLSDDNDDDDDEEDMSEVFKKTSKPNGTTKKPTKKTNTTATNANGNAPTKKSTRSKKPEAPTKTNGRAKGSKKMELSDEDMEDDDGFQFTRSKSTAKPSKKPPTKNTKNRHKEPTPPPSPDNNNMKRKNDNQTYAFDSSETPFPAKRLRTNEPIFTTHNENNTTNHDEMNNNENGTPRSQNVALPISDTPVIRKNQELRRKSGVRRSSLSNRGKRVSSIGNGFVAVPHEEVDPKEFYKHSSSDIPEPHRMRQILLWCSKRVVDSQAAQQRENNSRKKKPSTEEVTAQKIAQVITEELVRDLSDGKITTSWWSRPEEADYERVKKPNAHNVTNEQNLRAFEQKLADLEKEKQAWLSKLENLKTQTSAPDLQSSEALRDEQTAAMNKTLQVFDRVNENYQQVEPRIDRLYETVQRIGSISDLSGMFRDQYMQQISQQVGASSPESGGDESNVSMRDVLRALSRSIE